MTHLKHTNFVVRTQRGVVVVDAEILDVSSGGASIVTDSYQKPGDFMKIKLPSPGTDKLVPRLTEVIWAAPVNGKYKMGLLFVEQGPGSRPSPEKIPISEGLTTIPEVFHVREKV